MGFVHLADADDRVHLGYIESSLKSGGVRYFIPPRNVSPYSGGSLSVYVHPNDLDRARELIVPPEEEPDAHRQKYHRKRHAVKVRGEALSSNGKAILFLFVLLGILLVIRHITY